MSAVPRWVLAFVALSFAAQIAWQARRDTRAAASPDLPPSPGVHALRLAAFGEPEALARLAMVHLQSYGKPDYGRLVAWLEAILELDPRSQYPLFSAARVYAETADLHERFVPGNPDWGHPPCEDQAQTGEYGWAPPADLDDMFEPPIVRSYPAVQWFDGQGYADLMRSTSLYRKLDPDVREPLLDAIAERIRECMSDRASRCYLSFLQVERRKQ